MAKTSDQYLQEQATLSAENTFQPSQAVSEANQKLSDVNSGKPAEYKSEHADQLGGLYQQVLGRGSFQYDPGKDPMYDQYRQQYIENGQRAAADTKSAMGALTGGYGNTMGITAVNEQYGQNLQGINDNLAALKENAQAADEADANRQTAQLQTAAQQEAQDYSRWQDQNDRWRDDRDFAAQQAQMTWANDYQQFSDNMNNVMTVLGWEREDQQTVQANAYSWALTMLKKGIMPTAAVLQQAGISEADALLLAKKKGYRSGGGSGGSGKKSSGSGSAATAPSAPAGGNTDPWANI